MSEHSLPVHSSLVPRSASRSLGYLQLHDSLWSLYCSHPELWHRKASVWGHRTIPRWTECSARLEGCWVCSLSTARRPIESTHHLDIHEVTSTSSLRVRFPKGACWTWRLVSVMSLTLMGRNIWRRSLRILWSTNVNFQLFVTLSWKFKQITSYLYTIMWSRMLHSISTALDLI